MNLGDLEESLLNAGKEKGQAMADSMLGQEAAGGGLMGAVAGFGKEMFDNAVGGGAAEGGDDRVDERGNEQEIPESNEAPEAEPVEDRADESDSSEDNSNDDDDSKDGDDSDDKS